MLPPFDSNVLVLGAQVARAFIQAHRVAYARITPELRVSQASPNFGLLVLNPDAYSQGALLSEILWEFVGAESALTDILNGTEVHYTIERVNRELPDGTTLYLTFQVLPLDDQHPEIGLLLLIEDVTASGRLEQRVIQDRNELRLAQAALERANQELERLNRFKSFMVSMVAHDMRSPLSAILLCTDMLRDEWEAAHLPDQSRQLNLITSQINWQTSLIDNLLSLDQIERGKLPIQLVFCDLGALVQNVLADLKSIADSHKLTFTLNLPDPPIQVEADRGLIKQVIHNLVSNAIKYTPMGSHVKINLEQDVNRAVLKVSDNGPGMPPERVSQLFQPYYRTEEVLRSLAPGSGLGLFIARTLVDAHNGYIMVDTRLGEGTTFTVSLPLRQPTGG